MSEHAAAAAPTILAVDDAEESRVLVGKVLAARYQVKLADSGAAALRLLQEGLRPDLILLDVMMVGMDGYKVCKAIKENPATSDIPVIFLTVLSDAGDEAMGFQLGAVDYISKPVNPQLLRARVDAHIALHRRRRELAKAVAERTEELEKANQQLVHRLARVIEHHEGPAFRNQIMRVCQYVYLISQASGAKPKVCEMMVKAAPLYDIGKLAIPAQLLRKPGELTATEWKMVRRHPEIGAEIIGDHPDPMLRLARVMALSHHECWNGSGYPSGLKGEEIPWAGRVMAIVDAFENMTTTQYRREPISVEEAAAQIEKGATTAYDPALITPFKSALPTMKKVRAKLADALGEILDLDFTGAS